ncbi:MAG: hypothetical protein INR62_10270 [Rhodospirillales bacterium]|nr:hypothetical protein [Acetobacter sp.]
MRRIAAIPYLAAHTNMAGVLFLAVFVGGLLLRETLKAFSQERWRELQRRSCW